MVYARKQIKTIDMSTTTIVTKREDLVFKICIKYVMNFCESDICSVGRLCHRLMKIRAK